MPFFDWALLKSRTLHPDIGIPADDTQGLPYLSAFSVIRHQNYGLSAKTRSGTDSITGYLFTANTRFLLGSGEAIAIDYTDNDEDAAAMFAIDSLTGHVFTNTASSIINNPISISGNSLGWSGQEFNSVMTYCAPQITFFQYDGTKYVGFGSSDDTNFAIFQPGGIVSLYSGYASQNVLQPCNFYNGLYSILYSDPAYGSQYGFIPLAAAPYIFPAFAGYNIVSYSFTESALIFTYDGGTFAYDGIGDPTLSTSFFKIPFNIHNEDIFGYDPANKRLLSISGNAITVGGHAYYPVYVYNSVYVPPTPQQYSRPVKNFTVNGHLNWRKQR